MRFVFKVVGLHFFMAGKLISLPAGEDTGLEKENVLAHTGHGRRSSPGLVFKTRLWHSLKGYIYVGLLLCYMKTIMDHRLKITRHPLNCPLPINNLSIKKYPMHLI